MSGFFKKFKIKKASAIVLTLIGIIAILVYADYNSNSLRQSLPSDDAADPYLLVTKGNAIINRKTVIKLREKERSDIFMGDRITTFEKSAATIFWPDGSITRLAEKSSISIDEIRVRKDLSQIRIRFKLQSGKTWSDIIRFLTEGSYFTETYGDTNYAATVRGTVFEMNMDQKYIHAVSHDVDVIDASSDTSYTIPQGSARNATDIGEFVPKGAWDGDWIYENLAKDKMYFEEMMKSFENSMRTALKSQDSLTKSVAYVKSKLGSPKDYLLYELSDAILKGDSDRLERLQGDLNKLSGDEKASVEAKIKGLYQNIHSLPNEGSIPLLKSSLRKMMVQIGGADAADTMLSTFAKLDIYDYYEMKMKGRLEVARKLRSNIGSYLDMMKDPKRLQDLLSSFGKEMLESIQNDFIQLQQLIGTFIQRLSDEQTRQKIKEDMKEDITDKVNEVQDVLQQNIPNLNR